MKQTVYLETTIISYYTARISRDIILVGHQEITREWFETQSSKYKIFISPYVIDEISRGDVSASKLRLHEAKKYELLRLNPGIFDIAQYYIKEIKLTPDKFIDAYHLATATFYKMDYLLTWNCTHINNAEIKTRLMKLNEQKGFKLPMICTPEELIKD